MKNEYKIVQHEPYFKAIPERDSNKDEDDIRMVVSGLK
jgi:hypothetical protein